MNGNHRSNALHENTKPQEIALVGRDTRESKKLLRIDVRTYSSSEISVNETIQVNQLSTVLALRTI
jgi:hypothetical protein